MQLCGAIDAGITKVNFGTRLKHVYAAELRSRLRAEVRDPNLLIGSRETEDVCVAAGRALTDPDIGILPSMAIVGGGQALRYFRDTFGALEVRTGHDLGISAYDLLTVQARDVPPGSRGLLVLPYLMGERSPLWNPRARGVVMGLSLHHTRGHVLRAFLEGVGFALYDNYRQLVGGGIRTTLPLVFNEGGARSDVWRRIVTDIFGVPSVLLQGTGGAPLGDALLAGVAVGVLDGFDVAKEWAVTGDPMEPDDRRHRRYLEYFEVFRNVYDHLTDDFDDLDRLVRAGV